MLREVSGAPLAEGGIRVAADPAFLLPIEPRSVVDGLLAKAGVDADEPLLGVALRPWRFPPFSDDWEAEVAAALASHLGAHPRRVLFLPFHRAPGDPWADDEGVHARLTARLDGRCEIVNLALPDGFAPSLLAGLIARCERVLAMRFHAALFALRGAVPLVALAYDPKVSGLLASAGLEPLALPPTAWQRERIADALAAAPSLTDASALEPYVLAQRERAHRTIEAIGTALAAPRPARSGAARFLDEALISKALSAERLQELAAAATARADALRGEVAELQARIELLETALTAAEGRG